ncbi:hypothetical protein BKA00_003010 [Actinomadura coerulea]|uniref:DUF4132 domain-containing protein n=1 Tax=Actinomadura coerulea TaxID=46159 RepID=A0A7X0FYK6_9ACTN|nr:DUF4132 domain-containing protein [Actinomadura coerulea]MBB6396096.1 hypothetical protein [Actinomadura coerulea]GGQ41730.1 hypothetical protein GCM10010187_70060 [Actinomadura coerulea]
MKLVARLLRAMTEPTTEDEDLRTWYPDLSALSDRDLGDLVPAAYAVGREAPFVSMSVRLRVEDEAKQRQPRYTPEACERMFQALVGGLAQRKWADLELGVGALVRCTEPWPDLAGPARTLVEYLLARERLDQPFALLAIGGLAGDDVLRAVAHRLDRVRQGPIARDELDLVLRLEPAERVLLAELFDTRSFTSPAVAPHVWERVAAIPAFVEFARAAMEAAADRVRAVQEGEIPFRADKAFTGNEVAAVGHAARIALLRDEPWLPDLIDRLLPGVSVAPTQAKALPSQAMLYEIVRAAQEFPTPELVTAIRTVRGIVRHAGVPKQLDKMIKKVEAALAERTEVALRLPELGFGPDGVLRRDLGPYTAVVTVTAGKAELTFEKDGAALKGVPAPVRRDHKAEVAELRDLAKRVSAQLVTLARALEGGFTVDAVHPFARWRDTLLRHPIAGPAVRTLLWQIEAAPGDWRTVLPEADELPDAADDAPVRLWHPIRSRPDEVRAWRDLLVERRIRQPFKQAFREIYLLTPAEEDTATYSNRFAAHLVHYRRMFALFRARGWTSSLLGPWDGGGSDEAVRTLAAGEWRARFSHALADWQGEHEIAGTNRVVFDRRGDGGWREAALADVPPLVFSEAMRDVDLFVGVASIAADPMWEDGEGHEYWVRAWYADLGESTRTRREALERVLPRTRIADRCAIDGRYLVVRGELRTYKIHLGSANIVMEPDDAFLCVVPERRAAGARVFLPFEDERLSLIISKAFLLAADDAIEDESILMQIKRGA